MSAVLKRPTLCGKVRRGFKPPGKAADPEEKSTEEGSQPAEDATRQRNTFYPPTKGRTAQEILEDKMKERLGSAYEPPAKRKRAKHYEEAQDADEEEEEEEELEVEGADLPPAMLRSREEMQRRKDEQEKKEREEERRKQLEGATMLTRAQRRRLAGSDDESETSEEASDSSSSSEESVDEEGKPRVKKSRHAVSELGRLYFEGKVVNHSGSRHTKKGIVVVDVRVSAAQLYDRSGKQFGNRPDPGYILKVDCTGVKMNDELRLGGKLLRLGPAVLEEEFLHGAFFLRKNQRRKEMEKQRKKAEEKELARAAREGKNHLAHTGAAGITFGVSMVSKTATVAAAFRPCKFRRYKPKAGFTIPKKEDPSTKQQMPSFDPDREQAVVLYRAEYKMDFARRPLFSVVVDPIIGDKLRPHQVIGVKFLWDCITGVRVPGYFGCILADEMGLGKSIQAIALLWTALNQGKYGVPVARKAIIVAPSSLVQNWCNELEKWLGEDTIKPCSIAQSSAKGEKEKRMLSSFESDPDRNVLVISYDQLRKYEDRIKGISSIGLVICDEGHRLKNAEIKTTKAVDMIPTPRRVILSGTPLQNDLGEFHAMVNFCNPGVVGSISTFKTVFEIPIMSGREPTCPEHEKLLGGYRAHYLATLTNKFILQRKQTINEKYLPSKLEQTVFVKPSAFQIKLYETIVANKEDLLGAPDEEGPSKRMSPALVTITSLKKLCNHPDLIWEIIHNIEHPKDARSKKPEVRNLTKGMKAVKAAFPKNYEMHQSKVGVSGKLDFVQGLLAQLKAMPARTRDKVVIVSNYTQTLYVLAALCTSMGVAYFQLDGKTPIKKRQQLVDEFNMPGSSEIVFLLSSKAGGVGLNLIGANRLILYDPSWNPADDAQAMGRVWRDGQKKKVYIYRLLSTGTIEEKIYQRQVSKQGLSANVMDANDTSKQHFTNSELKALFQLKETKHCDTHDLLGCRCKQTEEDKAAAGDACRRPFKVVHERSGPRMDELKSWQHLASADEGNDGVLKSFAQGIVTFLFCNERESTRERTEIENSEGFTTDAAAITCDAKEDDSSSEVSIDSDDDPDDTE